LLKEDGGDNKNKTCGKNRSQYSPKNQGLLVAFFICKSKIGGLHSVGQ